MSTAKAIKSIMRELIHLNANPPIEGVKMVETSDMLDIQAWMAGPDGTPYSGGCFKIRLVPGPDFPESPPKGYFDTKIFHPNVSKAGEICVNTLKKDWKPELGIAHILLTIRCLLIAPNAESALNDDAGKLLLEDYDAFAKHARVMTALHAKLAGSLLLNNPFPNLLTPQVLSALGACVSAASCSGAASGGERGGGAGGGAAAGQQNGSSGHFFASTVSSNNNRGSSSGSTGGLVSASTLQQLYPFNVNSIPTSNDGLISSPGKKRIVEGVNGTKYVVNTGGGGGGGGVDVGGATTKLSEKRKTLKRL